MKILALEIHVQGADPKAFTDELLREEAACVWKLHQTGVIRELYFRADRRAAVLVLECASLDEANAILSTLPLVGRKCIDFDVVPLAPYSGFARLFERE